MYLKHTIDLEFFVVKIFLVVCANHEKKKKYTCCTMDNDYRQQIFRTHGYTAQLASDFA